MKNLFILSIIFTLVGFYSCQTRFNDEPSSEDYSSGESEVEISIVTDPVSRSTEYSTPNENIVENLDVLLFDSEGKFLCWRTTFKINGKLRTTLPIGKDYDACFLANCRSFIKKMLPDEVTESQYIGKADWEVFRKELVDEDPKRLLQNTPVFTCLPMWGMLEKQEVKDGVINYWPLLSLIRSVASVDVYVTTDIAEFTLKDATLYNVPDKGFWVTVRIISSMIKCKWRIPQQIWELLLFWNQAIIISPTDSLPISCIYMIMIPRPKQKIGDTLVL